MCTNEENPYLTDTEMYLFHVECYVRVVVTDLVVTIELGKLECVLDPFVLAFSVETMRFHNGGYRVAKRDLDVFYV